MASYNVVFARSARKELERLDTALAKRVWKRVESLVTDPRPAGCQKLRGHDNLWRLRAGDYRILYAIFEKELLIDIIAIRHRSDAYR